MPWWKRKPKISEEERLAALFERANSSFEKSQQLIPLVARDVLNLEQLDRLASLNLSQEWSIAEEIDILRIYLEGYKSSFGNMTYTFVADDNADPGPIKALVLLPIVQNACINGYNGMENYPVKVKVKVLGRTISLEVSNRVNHHLADQSDTDLMDQARARLDFSYFGRYNLFLNSNSNLFKATLLLQV